MTNISKKCFKCGKTLLLTQFYKHNAMTDGHLNKCIVCTIKDVKKREFILKNDPEWVLKERKRCRLKYYKSEKTQIKNVDKKRAIQKYHQKYPEKAMARKYTEIFLTKTKTTHLHHWSYRQEDWLDIIELLVKDHYFFHRFIKYDQERMMYRNLDDVLLDTKEKHLNYFNFCKENYE